MFIADNSINRLVCWVGFLSLKEKKIFLRDAGSTTQNPAQTPTALLDIVTDAAVTQWELATNANTQRTLSIAAKRVRTRNAAAGARY